MEPENKTPSLCAETSDDPWIQCYLRGKTVCKQWKEALQKELHFCKTHPQLHTSLAYRAELRGNTEEQAPVELFSTQWDKALPVKALALLGGAMLVAGLLGCIANR